MKQNLILAFLISFFCNNISAQVCTGIPTPGTLSASTTSSCTSFASTLTLSGASSGTGIEYQWEFSTDGTTFTPISGATSTSYIATITDSTWFRVVVTCTNSGLSAITPNLLLYIDVSPILGAPTVCAGFTTSLSNSITGGTWASSTTSVATVHATTGVVTGIMSGTTTITYSYGPGCSSTAVITVNPLPPAISGTASVCAGNTTTLTNSVAPGSWTSSNPSIATIGFSSGAVAGIVAGTATITYTIGTGCFNIRTVTVNPLPAAISGAAAVCAGSTTNFTDATSGGAWTSSTPAIATVGVTTGVVSGVSAGTATITYTILSTGCIATKALTVHVSPSIIGGTGHVCIGATATLTDSIPGGTWSSSTPTVATIGSATGIASGLTLGTSVITYTLPTGSCQATKTVTVQPLPNIYALTGGGSYCAGGTGDSIGLTGSDIGVSYVLYFGSSVTGFVAGTGTAVDFGPHTVAGTYSAVATNALTGCSNNMSGTATISITPLITPLVSITTGVGDSICPGTTVHLTPLPVNGGSLPTYKWYVNGVLVSTSGTYSYIPADSDIVKVVLTSNATCVSPDTAIGTKTLSVLTPGMPLVNFSVYPNDTVCQYTPVTFTALPVFGGSSPTYKWIVGSSLYGTGSTFTYVPTNGNVVYCKMYSNYLCRLADSATSGTATMSVAPLTIPHVDIHANPGLSILSGQVDTLTAVVTSGGPNPTYQWQVNGTDVVGATTSTYISTFNNYDSVSCVVTSSGICYGITVFDWVFITYSNLGAPSLTAGEMDVRLMPNPNKGTFILKGTLASHNDEEVSIEITDMLGRVVYNGKTQSQSGRINEQIQMNNALANGMYMLNVRSSNEQKVFHLVIEQ